MTPSEIVQAQFDAYNAHDLEAFLATYSDDIEIFRMPDTAPSMRGKAAMVARYRDHVFNVPGHRAEVLHRICNGNKVVDHERVFGLREQPHEVVAVYQVENQLISKVWFFSPE
jgi:hypothetical protein